MFYEEKEISGLILCPYCKNKFNDPRLVECSSSFCMPCIEFLTKNGETGFKCPVCDEFHETPKKGYLKNANLAKLCEKKAVEVSRSKQAEDFKRKLRNFKQNLDKLANKNKPSIEIIKEYCANLRNEVQLSSEELVETIKKYNLELIEQINAYEKSSLLDFNKQNKIILDDFIGGMYAFHSKWIEYFKQLKLDDNAMSVASNEADGYLELIKSENEEILLDKTFNAKVLKFNKNSTELKSSIIGSLINANRKLNFSKQLGYLQAHQLTSLNNHNQPITVKFLNADEKILLAYRETNMYWIPSNKAEIKLKIFDKGLNLLHEKLSRTARYFESFQLKAMANNSIVLCLVNLNQPNNYYNIYLSDDEDTPIVNADTLSVISLYDDTLKKLKKISLNYVVSSMDTFDNKIFCLSGENSKNGLKIMKTTMPKIAPKNKNTRSIYVYDSRLIMLQHLEETYSCLSFSMPNSVSKMQVCESFYVLFNKTEVTLMDKHDGSIKASFNVRSNDYLLNPHANVLLAYDDSLKQVVSYDLDGKSQAFSSNFSNPNASIQLVDCSNEKLLFLDPSSNCLYF